MGLKESNWDSVLFFVFNNTTLICFAFSLKEFNFILLFIKGTPKQPVIYFSLLLQLSPLLCGKILSNKRASLVAQRVKRLPAMQETGVRSLGREDPLEKEMATHSSILAWRIPWTEEADGLQSTGSQRVGHDWATSLSLSNKGRKRQINFKEQQLSVKRDWKNTAWK